MNWYISIYFTFCCLICVCKIVVGVNEQFIEKLALAKNVTDVEIEKIYQEWAIKDYPNFLKSCSMHKSSWELMKYKLILKILSAHTTASSQDYVLSFLGSSVAAGHDSHFNLSYPIVVGNLMRKSFSVLNVNLISRNMALGNNPCMPYDVCVKIFAGLDADVVHWEQTYNCPNSKILEQFVRQSLTIPNQPVVVFSESATAHWKPSKCDKMPPSHLVSGEEKALLDADVVKLVSELNKDEFKRAWGVLHDVSRTYREAGIQTFTHVSHEKYACLGPYIKDWEKGAAAWHPSVIGHRLRASHHAYFWLLCWRDAIVDLVNLASHRPLEAIAKDTTRHISALHRPVPTPIHPTPVPDNIDCLSDYEPRADRGASLKAHVLAGLSTGEASTSAMWKSIIYENLVHENLVKQGQKMGYQDFKHLLYGDKSSGPVSILITPKKAGALFICQTPGIWGALPDGFKDLWEALPEVYITKNIDKTAFVFAADKADKQAYTHTKEMEICMKLNNDVTQGLHALTILPTTEDKVIIAWVLVP